jgi:hypothetical protein
VAIRGPHHRDLGPDAVQADGGVRHQALDLPLAFQFHAELGEERDGGVQVVDDDPDVVHPLNGQVRQHTDAASRQPGAEGTDGSVGLTVTPIDSVTLSDAYDAGERAPTRRSGRLATPRRSPVEARRLVSLRAASRARLPGIRGEVIDGDVADYHHKGGRSRPGPGWFSAVGWVLLLAGPRLARHRGPRPAAVRGLVPSGTSGWRQSPGRA